MYKICFYVPEVYLDEVKEALFRVGVGRIGNYDKCCWQSKGFSQFRALSGSKPFIGAVNKLEVLEEYKVEMVCENHLIKEAINMLKQAHPYEVPAIDVWMMDDVLLST